MSPAKWPVKCYALRLVLYYLSQVFWSIITKKHTRTLWNLNTGKDWCTRLSFWGLCLVYIPNILPIYFDLCLWYCGKMPIVVGPVIQSTNIGKITHNHTFIFGNVNETKRTRNIRLYLAVYMTIALAIDYEASTLVLFLKWIPRIPFTSMV